MKLKLLIVAILLIGLVITARYISSIVVTEGYVASTDDKRILTISLEELGLSSSEASALSGDELNVLLDEKVEELAGNFYDVPLINRQLNSTYKKGEKVKVYWNGTLYTSMPGQVTGTIFINKMKE